MGLFKTKKSSATVPVPQAAEDSSSSIPTNDNSNTNGKQRKKKKFSFLKQSKQQTGHDQALVGTAAVKTTKKPTIDNTQQARQQQVQQQRDNHKETLEEEEDDNIGDIPRSISTPSRDDGELLPPLPSTPKNNNNDQDSIGSPCESMLKNQQQQEGAKACAKNEERVAKLQAIMTQQQTPSLEHVSHYIAALSQYISPDPSADLPSRALRCLFSLSEHSSHKAQRITMVRSGNHTSANGAENADDDSSSSLIPALLSFLKRCPRDSSEQYLTLLVLNNLSIPTQNKRLIALEFGGAETLGRLLCEDPGCHLLVIIIVNLTFGDDKLNRDLLTVSGTSSQQVGGGDESDSCGGDVQLVDSLGYALLLASLTTEQLATLGPIPLTSPEGIPYTPRTLLTLLFSLLESKLGIRYQNSNAASSVNEEEDAPPLSLGSDDCPFPETARWCLSALKNLTRPGKLSSSSVDAAAGNPNPTGGDTAAAATITNANNDNNKEEEQVTTSEEMGFLTNRDASAVAAQAILDAGILPLLLRILKHKEDAPTAATSKNENSTAYSTGGFLYSWQSNTAQDAALYTLMHMASVPQVRRVLREDYHGCVEVLVSILNYGKVISDRLKNAAMSGGVDGNYEEEDVELGRSSLQCLKARMTLSYLVLSSENNANLPKYGSATTLADHETHSLVDLLSHCLQGRAKEGPGGYSAATFTLKGALHVVKCILSKPKNREMFASTIDGSRLNALLLKAVAQYSLRFEEVTEIMDAQAVEHAVVSIYWMTMYGLDESSIGFSNPFGRQSIFLPATFGDHGKKTEAMSVVAKVFTAYLNKDGITLRGRHAANQVLFRVNYLRFEGSVADMAYPGKKIPSKSDFDMDDKLLAAIEIVSGEELQTQGAKPKEYIFGRAVSQNEKEGIGSKVFSSVGGATGSKSFSSPLIAAEDLAAQQPAGPIDAIAIANNIAYYADGLDIYYGFVWKWEDGQGDLIERIYSAAETENEMLAPEDAERSEPYSPPRMGLLGRLKIPTPRADDNEPFSIFGFRCGAQMCGRGY